MVDLKEGQMAIIQEDSIGIQDELSITYDG